ncbi:MAG: aldo/keto reductase [Bacteroidaceae bacterium]|nr:aldo/keto reductase [Bacteroidaceae bacterium]
MKNDAHDVSRRDFLRRMGIGVGTAVTAMVLDPFEGMAETGRKKKRNGVGQTPDSEPLHPSAGMTYRIQHGTGDRVSLLGYGMMRLPSRDRQIDQDMVNQEVDYALEHGVNYFDTSPGYHGGRSEVAMGIALSRHPRDKYLVATKMSNFNRNDWTLERSKQMYEGSFRKLQVEVIDYYLLHSVAGSMDELRGRFLDNGVLDFLLEERKAGRIRNLGFSHHGDVRVFDHLLSMQDEVHWDFVQIQMNYLDWRHGKSSRNTDAEYLYNKLDKLGIQAVIMEPLRGGRLANLPDEAAKELRERRPDDSIASWAFRWVGSHPNVLTALSGMTTMEVLKENVRTFSPLDPCNADENALLERVADSVAGFPTVPCTACNYCMPCPYGVDIPGNFAYYNKAVDNHLLPLPDKSAPEYAERARQFAEGYRQTLPEAAWATKCADCEACLSKCPQKIRIPNQLGRIVELTRKRR